MINLLQFSIMNLFILTDFHQIAIEWEFLTNKIEQAYNLFMERENTMKITLNTALSVGTEGYHHTKWI